MRPALILVACAGLLAMDGDPRLAAIANRTVERVRASNRTIPRYACVETITRDFYSALAPIPRSCELVVEKADNRPLDMKLRRAWTDRLRLDVGMAASGEMHSWVGESRFEERRIDSLIPEGPIGTGAFGGFLSAIFDTDAKSYRYLGETTIGGHTRVRFGFSVAVESSHYKAKVRNTWTPTAYSGVFEADPETGDPVWVTVATAILPLATGTCQTVSRLEIARTALGRGEFLITTRARQRYILSDGGEVVNTIEFSGCREYRGESSIRYETEPAGEASAGGTKVEPPELYLPGGERFALELTAPIDSATAAAGDPFFARVSSPVRNYFGRVLLPSGSRVEGRILRVQTFYGAKPEVVLVLRPQSVEVRGVKYPLSAAGDVTYATRQQRPVVGAKKGALIVLPYRHETNAGLYRFPGERAVVPRGFVSQWRVR